MVLAAEGVTQALLVDAFVDSEDSEWQFLRFTTSIGTDSGLQLIVLVRADLRLDLRSLQNLLWLLRSLPDKNPLFLEAAVDL